MFLQAPQPLIVSYHESMRGTVYEERNETGLCLSPDTLWNLLLLLFSHAFDSSTDGVYPVQYPHRWLALQGGSPPHQDQSQNCTCAWCPCSLLMMLPLQHIPRQQCRGPSTIRQQVWKLWPHWISLKKTNVSMSAQDVSQASEIKIGDHTFDLIISIWTRALTQKSPKESAKHRHHVQIEKKRAWKNKYLNENTKMYIYIYQAAPCSEAVNLDHPNERESRLNSFHLRCLGASSIGVKWQDHITNSEILSRAGIPRLSYAGNWEKVNSLESIISNK